MKRLLLALLLLSLLGHLCQYEAYQKLDRYAMQADALLDWSNALLRSHGIDAGGDNGR